MSVFPLPSTPDASKYFKVSKQQLHRNIFCSRVLARAACRHVEAFSTENHCTWIGFVNKLLSVLRRTLKHEPRLGKQEDWCRVAAAELECFLGVGRSLQQAPSAARPDATQPCNLSNSSAINLNNGKITRFTISSIDSDAIADAKSCPVASYGIILIFCFAIIRVCEILSVCFSHYVSANVVQV